MVLEGDEAGGVMITAAEIQFSRSLIHRILYRSPHEHYTSAESIEPRIGATVFVGDYVLKRQRDDACDRRAILRCDPDLQAFAKAVDQIPEPQ